MALPMDVRDVVKSGTRLTEERELPVRLAVLVEVDAPDALIDAIRDALRPRTSRASLQIEVAELGQALAVPTATDAVIAIAGSGNVGLSESLRSPRAMRLPVVVVGLGEDGRLTSLADSLMQPTADVVVRATPEHAVERLGAWLADSLGSKRLALAHNFAFMRKAVAEDAVKTTAWQNGLLGAVTPIAGADMPIMTANQAKMLLQIAAAYGEPLGVERAKELLAIVGGGYLLRALARQALTVVPVLGWVIKGGIGYTGTLAMGKAAIRYFEEGADFGQVLGHLRELRDSAASRLPRRKGAVAALPETGQLSLPVSSGEAAGD